MIDEARSRGDKGFYGIGVSGMTAFFEQDEEPMYLTDRYGLMDPLLSHLPAIKMDDWRIGHMVRKEPEGYSESVATGENLLENDGLREYYDKVLYIITGDIWDKNRIQTIIDINTGKYDHLLDDYISRQ